MSKQYKWVDFYMEFATKLLEYRKDRSSLIEELQKVYSIIGMKLPKLEKDNLPKDIDPFTVFGLFNKGITDANRITILGGIASEFGITAEVPDDFSGIPVLNNMMATFYAFEGDERRKDNDIDNLWRAFEAAINLLSFIQLFPKDWKKRSYLSLGGVSSAALMTFLSEPLKLLLFSCDWIMTRQGMRLVRNWRK